MTRYIVFEATQHDCNHPLLRVHYVEPRTKPTFVSLSFTFG